MSGVEHGPRQGIPEVPLGGAGDADGFDRLWTPHRMAYIKGENKPAGSEAGQECPFCRVPGLPEDEGLVVARGTSAFVVLNRYPYNSGHLLICPYRHVADYTGLDEAETAEVARLTQEGITALSRAARPAGFNVGMNLGAAAGAGIAAHLHQHIVPRWAGDTNFMPVVGQTKVLPQLLQQTRDQLARHWPEN